MPLLIDGYNVLHTTMPPMLAGLDEHGLCMALYRSGLAQTHGGAIIICDGMVKPGGPAESRAPGVSLRYSGKDQSADDVIADMVSRSDAPRRLTVVSSDRQVAKAARRRRCNVWSSDMFVQQLAAALGGRAQSDTDASPAQDPELTLDEEETRRWLREFGLDGDAPLDDKSRGPWWR